MLLRCISKFALLTSLVVAGTSSPVNIRASEDLVRTPAGLVPSSNVHAVPNGARVEQSPTAVQIIAANGTVIHSVPYTNLTAGAPLPKRPSNGTNTRRDLESGWIAYTYWENTGPSPISFFGSNWVVPAIPTSWDGQLLYWFNGLEPAVENAILQPVLQYGFSPAGGGEFYALASWWLIGNDVYHTDISLVSPGTYLQGQMTLTGTSTSGGVTTYDYQSTFVGYPGTTISASTTEELAWAFETLEIYGTEFIPDLPYGNTVYSAIDIAFQNGQHPSSIPWGASSDSVDNVNMTVLSTSSTNVTHATYYASI
ncbi:hypothetical protein CPB84DRAFT_239319 [Gymnopilus junonius]|uniref:Uncharacterized protein n=1 Tax=Gymnopilus junonius TaxID=109634 RepID=A0A9P5NVH8_GYMJU|nr:hypothetical protein CPB84DRAFT_239319 [Gymnopilus junonius]